MALKVSQPPLGDDLRRSPQPPASSTTTTTKTKTAPRTVSYIIDDSSSDVQRNNNDSATTTTTSSSFLFLSESAIEKLPQFQYRGEDRSLLYYYVLSPLASFCVEHLTPRWIAPNTVTLIGLFLMVTSYSAMWYYVPNLESAASCTSTLDGGMDDTTADTTADCAPPPPPPRWIFLWNALAILCYQTLDNMDGKQARRTGSSSPLGLLFDHGCDAINSMFGSANWIISCGLSPFHGGYYDAALCFSMLFGPYGLFYVGTWEEYYTGALILPFMNGANEGLMGAVLVSLTSWWFGPSFWQQYTAWDEYLAPFLSLHTLGDVASNIRLRHVDILVMASCIGYFQEISLKILSVVKSTYYPSDASGARRGGITIVAPDPKPCLDLMPFFTLVACFWIIGYKDLDILSAMPRTTLHLSSVLFAEMTTDLMLAHITDQVYQERKSLYQRWILLLPLILLTLAVVLGWHTSSRRATSDFLLVYTTVVTCYFAAKAAIVIREICAVLNIWCFDITTPRRRKQATNVTARHENGHSKTQ